MPANKTQTTCPRCGQNPLNEVLVRNALSRKDTETYVCASCGTDEAMVNLAGGRDADVWPGYPGLVDREALAR